MWPARAPPARALAAALIALLAVATGSLAQATINPGPPPATDRMTVPVPYVPAATVTTLVFTSTTGQAVRDRDIALVIPAGWTPPSASGPDGGITAACAQASDQCALDSQASDQCPWTASRFTSAVGGSP